MGNSLTGPELPLQLTDHDAILLKSADQLIPEVRGTFGATNWRENQTERQQPLRSKLPTKNAKLLLME